MLNEYARVIYNNKNYKVGTDKHRNVFVVNDEVKLPYTKFVQSCIGYFMYRSCKTEYMHALVMDYTFDGNLYIDHINRIKTDNRRENLRLVTQSQQNMNQSKRKRNVQLPEGCGIKPEEIPTFIWYIKPNGSHGERWMVEIKGKYMWKTTASKELSTKCKFEMAKKHLRELIKNEPEMLKDHSINGSLSEDGERLKNEYIQILKLAGFEYKDQTKKYSIDEDLTGLTDTEIHILRTSRGNRNTTETGIRNPIKRQIKSVNYDLPKYCCYISANSEKGDGFAVSKQHEKQKTTGKRWETTRSKTITTDEKYKQLMSYLKNEVSQ